MQDLIAGQIDLLFGSASSLPQVRSGLVKAYAVMAKQRLPGAPEIPTVDEAGLPGFYYSNWHSLWVPKGTSKAIIAGRVPKPWICRIADEMTAIATLDATIAGPSGMVEGGERKRTAAEASKAD
jgi:hypothetical protein